MICEECKKQFKSEEVRLSLYGLCSECVKKLKFYHFLEGYWYGVLGSALPIYILILSPNSGSMFLPIVILGPLLTYAALYLVVKRLGKKLYRSNIQFKKWSFLKKIAGAAIGFTSIFGWFYLALQYWGGE